MPSKHAETATEIEVEVQETAEEIAVVTVEPELDLPETAKPKKKVTVQKTEPEMVPIFIPSMGIETTPITENGQTARYVFPEINGHKTKVQCDVQQMVPPDIHAILVPMLERRKQGY